MSVAGMVADRCSPAFQAGAQPRLANLQHLAPGLTSCSECYRPPNGAYNPSCTTALAASVRPARAQASINLCRRVRWGKQ
jgi:hypothetical protein